MTSIAGCGIRCNTHNDSVDVRNGGDEFNAGSISALDISVSVYYNHSNTTESDVSFAKNELVLIDIQYLGTKRTAEQFLEDLENPRINSLFISKDSNIHKILCSKDSMGSKLMRSPRKSISAHASANSVIRNSAAPTKDVAVTSKSNRASSTRASSSSKNDDCVTDYITSLLPDVLEHHYTDYDSFLEGFVSKTMYAGAITKMKRYPIISVYRNSDEIKFKQASAGNEHSITDANKTNFIVYSGRPNKNSPHIYLVADPKKVNYITSYTIDPRTSALVQVKGVNSLENYKLTVDKDMSDLSIDGCTMVKLIAAVKSS